MPRRARARARADAPQRRPSSTLVVGATVLEAMLNPAQAQMLQATTACNRLWFWADGMDHASATRALASAARGARAGADARSLSRLAPRASSVYYAKAETWERGSRDPGQAMLFSLLQAEREAGAPAGFSAHRLRFRRVIRLMRRLGGLPAPWALDESLDGAACDLYAGLAGGGAQTTEHVTAVVALLSAARSGASQLDEDSVREAEEVEPGSLLEVFSDAEPLQGEEQQAGGGGAQCKAALISLGASVRQARRGAALAAAVVDEEALLLRWAEEAAPSFKATAVFINLKVDQFRKALVEDFKPDCLDVPAPANDLFLLAAASVALNRRFLPTLIKSLPASLSSSMRGEAKGAQLRALLFLLRSFAFARRGCDRLAVRSAEAAIALLEKLDVVTLADGDLEPEAPPALSADTPLSQIPVSHYLLIARYQLAKAFACGGRMGAAMSSIADVFATAGRRAPLLAADARSSLAFSLQYAGDERRREGPPVPHPRVNPASHRLLPRLRRLYGPPHVAAAAAAGERAQPRPRPPDGRRHRLLRQPLGGAATLRDARLRRSRRRHRSALRLRHPAQGEGGGCRL